MNRTKAQFFSGLLKGLERIGGFGGKSDLLAENAVFGGRPDYYKELFEVAEKATIEDIKQAAQKWLSSGRHTLV